jgi:acyl-CoA-binding protein
LQNKSDILEAAALDIIKAIDYDLWKEVKKSDDEDLVETVVELLEDVIARVEEDSVDDDNED